LNKATPERKEEFLSQARGEMPEDASEEQILKKAKAKAFSADVGCLCSFSFASLCDFLSAFSFCLVSLNTPAPQARFRCGWWGCFDLLLLCCCY
jgi:hypothetical protein